MYFNGTLITALTGIGATRTNTLLNELGIEHLTARQLSHKPKKDGDLIDKTQWQLFLNALEAPVGSTQEKAAANFAALEEFFTGRLVGAGNSLAVGSGAIPDTEVRAELDAVHESDNALLALYSTTPPEGNATEEPDGALDFLSSLGGDESDEAPTDNPLDFLENGPDEPVSYDRSALEKDDTTPPWSEGATEGSGNTEHDDVLDAIFGGTLS